MSNPRIQFNFKLLVAGIGLALILPTLAQDGMFMDGLLYSCVAKNLADGHGTFWFPHYSKVMYPFFNQQPPFGFGILSLFYQVLGNSIYVERFYCLLMAVLNAVLIITIWKEMFQDQKAIKILNWLPVFFWITIPVCFWAYSNGVLENTMSVFDLVAILCIVKFFRRQKLWLIILAGLFTTAAMLTKGFQGAFPLIGIVAGWMALRPYSLRRSIVYTLALMAVPAFIFFILFQFDAPRSGLMEYLNVRVLNSINHVANVDNRFYLIGRLLLELSPVIFLSALIYWIGVKKESVNTNSPMRRLSLFFLMIGVAASAPLIVTLEQRGFYLVTSLPYFAIAIAIWPAPYLSLLTGKINMAAISFRWFSVLSWVLFVSVLIFSAMQLGKSSRDQDTLHDIYLIGDVVPSNSLVGSNQQLWTQWSFQEYLIRHFYIHLDSQISDKHVYVILEADTPMADSLQLQKVDIPTIKYHLYKKL